MHVQTVDDDGDDDDDEEVDDGDDDDDDDDCSLPEGRFIGSYSIYANLKMPELLTYRRRRKWHF